MTPSNARVDILSPIFSTVTADDQINDDDVDDGDEEETSAGEEDDSEDSDGESEESGSDDAVSTENILLTGSELLELYQGPSQWSYLILPPTREFIVEPHFQTSFWIDEIPASLLSYWEGNQNDTRNIAIEGNENEDYYQRTFPTCTLPPPNTFIPERLDVVLSDTFNAYPSPIMRSESFCIWHLYDSKRYPVPKCELIIRVVSSISSKDSKARPLSFSDDDVLEWILHDLSIHVLREVMNETIYVASLAELYCDIFDSRNAGLGIKISGFNDKAPDLLVKCLETYFCIPYKQLRTNGSEILNDQTLSRLVENLTRIYANANTKTASAATNARSTILAPTIPSLQQRHVYIINHATKISRASLKDYMDRHFQAVYVEVLVQGNICQRDAELLCQRIHELKVSSSDDTLSSRLSSLSFPITQVLKLPVFGSTNQRKFAPLLVQSTPSSIQEKNICVIVHFQIGAYEPQLNLILHLFDQIITEPFFDDLRTKQQVSICILISNQKI